MRPAFPYRGANANARKAAVLPALPPLPIAKADIEKLIPHAGAMHLLDGVSALEEAWLEAWSEGHRAPDHPLRADGRLPASAAIEYASQAIATHTALVSIARARPPIGYLAVLSGVRWACTRLDDVPGRLSVRVERLSATRTGLLYDFAVSGPDGPLVSGQQLIALIEDDDGGARP